MDQLEIIVIYNKIKIIIINAILSFNTTFVQDSKSNKFQFRNIHDSISTLYALLIYTSNIKRLAYRRAFPRTDNGMEQILQDCGVNPAIDIKSIIVKRVIVYAVTHAYARTQVGKMAAIAGGRRHRRETSNGAPCADLPLSTRGTAGAASTKRIQR